MPRRLPRVWYASLGQTTKVDAAEALPHSAGCWIVCNVTRGEGFCILRCESTVYTMHTLAGFITSTGSLAVCLLHVGRDVEALALLSSVVDSCMRGGCFGGRLC